MSFLPFTFHRGSAARAPWTSYTTAVQELVWRFMGNLNSSWGAISTHATADSSSCSLVWPISVLVSFLLLTRLPAASTYRPDCVPQLGQTLLRILALARLHLEAPRPPFHGWSFLQIPPECHLTETRLGCRVNRAPVLTAPCSFPSYCEVCLEVSWDEVLPLSNTLKRLLS